MSENEKKPYSAKKRAYNIEYAKKSLKRIPLDVSVSKFEEIKEASAAVGETVNGYIKKAIDRRMSEGN